MLKRAHVLKSTQVFSHRKHLLQWVSDHLDFKVPRTTSNWTLCCTCLIHEAEDRLHIRICFSDTGQQGIFVAPQQFIHSASCEEANPDIAHCEGQHTSLKYTPSQLVHHSLETGSRAQQRRYWKEFMDEVEGSGGIEETIHYNTEGSYQTHIPLSPVWISTLLYLSKTFSSWLTQDGMLTVVMLSTDGSPTDFSLRNTKLLVLYADTFEPFATMLTLSLYLYSLSKHEKMLCFFFSFLKYSCYIRATWTSVNEHQFHHRTSSCSHNICLRWGNPNWYRLGGRGHLSWYALWLQQ